MDFCSLIITPIFFIHWKATSLSKRSIILYNALEWLMHGLKIQNILVSGKAGSGVSLDTYQANFYSIWAVYFVMPFISLNAM